MNQIDISVIILVYNAALLLNRCHNFIFNQYTNHTFCIVLSRARNREFLKKAFMGSDCLIYK